MKRIPLAIFGMAVVLITGSLVVHQRHIAWAKADSDGVRQLQQTPQWQKLAATFNTHKKTAQSLFDSATKVETFRLFPDSSHSQDAALGSLRGFPYYSHATLTDATFAHRLGKILFDPQTYTMPGQSTTQCYFEPGVAFRVWSGPKYADAIICFHCNQLGVVENDPRIPQRDIGGRLDAHMNVLGEFKPAREQLLALTKEAFATDEAVQAAR